MITDEYYCGYVISYDGCRVKLDLVLEKEKVEEILYEIPVFESFMSDLKLKPFDLAAMKCLSIGIWFSQYGICFYHEDTNLLMKTNIGIQTIYKDYNGRVIIIFNKFYLSFLEKLTFGMYVPSNTGVKFENIAAYFCK